MCVCVCSSSVVKGWMENHSLSLLQRLAEYEHLEIIINSEHARIAGGCWAAVREECGLLCGCRVE